MPRKNIPTATIRNGKTTLSVTPIVSRIKQREPSGRLQRERVAEIVATASANRLKLGVPASHVRSQLAGSALGRLHLQQLIDRDQYEAGCRFAAIAIRYARVMGIPSANPRAANLLIVATTLPGGFDPGDDVTDPALIMKARRAYEDMFNALTSDPDGRKYLKALKECALQDQGADIGALRCGLNLLIRLWR